MAVFDDIVIKWDGNEKTVPADRVMRLIAKIEDVITLQELYRYMERGLAPMAKMAMAYSEVLRYVGFRVTADEVYAKLMQGGEEAETASMIVHALLEMMVPPADLDVQKTPDDGTAKKKPKTKSS